MSMSINPKVLRQPKLSRKILEVKEVVQNRSDQDIAKVLEHFEYDVGKSIDAFVSDGGKQALSKWSEARSQLNSSQSSLISESGKRPPGKKSNKPNLNDLVASVIDQYTAVSASSTPAASLSPPEPKPEALLDTLSRLGTETSINGYKVTILGIETPSQNQSNSSSTSPSSVSVASSASFERPQQLEITKPQFNKSYTNPNAKSLLEKPIKDLHRQTLQLNKIEASIDQQVEKSAHLLNKTYQQLVSLLAERKAKLEGEIRAAGQQAINLVKQRQNKAANLKLFADNSQHLNDAECNELRADIKHFVSERLLDEQLANVSFFSIEPAQMELVVRELGSFGSVGQVKNHYSAKRPAHIEDILTPVENLSRPVEPKPPRANKKTADAAKTSLPNGAAEHDDGEGEFIEVKKPQRNRNRQNGPQVNGRAELNGSQRPLNGTARNQRK